MITDLTVGSVSQITYTMYIMYIVYITYITYIMYNSKNNNPCVRFMRRSLGKKSLDRYVRAAVLLQFGLQIFLSIMTALLV